jgi:hypothetical protein
MSEMWFNAVVTIRLPIQGIDLTAPDEAVLDAAVRRYRAMTERDQWEAEITWELVEDGEPISRSPVGGP